MTRSVQGAAWIMTGLAAICLASAGPEDVPELVRQALERTEGSPPEGWAYTETAVENGLQTVRVFDPRRPEKDRWQLVSIDGRPPTDEERREAAGKRSGKDGSDNDPDEDDGEDGIEETIKPGSLRLVEDRGDRVLYSFEPVSEDEDDARIWENLDATLEVVKDGPYVAAVDMRSRGPFKPGFGLKISEFVLTQTFQPVEEGGPAFPRAASVRLTGRALLVKKISEVVEVTYGDYEHVGE